VATFQGASSEASRIRSVSPASSGQACSQPHYDFRVSRSKKSAPDWLTPAELTITGFGRESTQQPATSDDEPQDFVNHRSLEHIMCLIY
jgi:hypothetical protein